MWSLMFWLLAVTGIAPSDGERQVVKRAANFTVQDVNYVIPKPITTDGGVSGAWLYPCYVSVIVYRSPERRGTIQGATVTVLTKERGVGNTFIGYSQTKTDRRGHACVLTLCRKDAIIFVEYKNERLYAMKNQSSVPVEFRYAYQTRNEEITFSVRSWGTYSGKTGPVYNLGEEGNCMANGKANRHFDFTSLAIQAGLTATAEPLTVHNKPLAWEYEYPTSLTHRVCYMKVKIQVRSYKASISLESKDDRGNLYGIYTAGPKENPQSGNPNLKAACLEYRCAVRDSAGKLQNTSLTGKLDVPSHPNGCKYRIVNGLKTKMKANQTSFSLSIHGDNNFGPNYGLFEAQTRKEAKARCYTGSNRITSGYKMDPTTAFSISYICDQSVLPVG